MTSDPLTLSTIAKATTDEDAARELLEKMRWPNGVACPHCGGADPYKLTPKPGSKTRKGLYKCRACRKQFTVTVKTVFEDSHIPVSKWLLGIHLICSSKKGMSAHQLHRNLGISYKAAWFMSHRLRYAMKENPLAGLLAGVVEVDETYVGGRRRGGKRGRPGADSHKAPVVALVQRGGQVRVMAMPRVTAETLGKAVRENMKHDAQLMTDDFPPYKRIGHVDHETVNHSQKEYVRKGTNVHTNTVEGFFSLLKRGINGTFHHVSKGHLHRYCDEFAFRYNNRTALGVTDGERSAKLVSAAEGKRLTYKHPESVS